MAITSPLNKIIWISDSLHILLVENCEDLISYDSIRDSIDFSPFNIQLNGDIIHFVLGENGADNGWSETHTVQYFTRLDGPGNMAVIRLRSPLTIHPDATNMTFTKVKYDHQR